MSFSMAPGAVPAEGTSTAPVSARRSRSRVGTDLTGHGRTEGASEGQDEARTGVSADRTEVGEGAFSKPVGLQGWEAGDADDLQGQPQDHGLEKRLRHGRA